MRKFPIGIQSFEDLRRNNYLYVDKTALIYDLVNNGKVYFLSRPRRFGKSLLISTLEALFRGKRDLFEGLYIDTPLENSYQWTVYPVLHFSLAGGEYDTAEGLESVLEDTIKQAAEEYQLSPDMWSDNTLSVRFRKLIRCLYEKTGKQIVVLVDEYDKPLLVNIDENQEMLEANRRTLKSFWGVLKDMDSYLRFVFFTGVTKFSKVSVFSDLNQLNDISLDDRYANLCGITEDELQKDFAPDIREVAEANGMDEKECLRQLAQMYDGYHFSKSEGGVYNPFSLLNTFAKKDFGMYWFTTGTPSFLIRKLMKSDVTIQNLNEGVKVSEQVLTDYTEEDPNPLPLFYQAGYLTITAFNRAFRVYTLRFPNNEVAYGFMQSLLPVVYHSRIRDGGNFVMEIVSKLMQGDVNGFMTIIQSLFAGIPYAEGPEPYQEREWRNQMYLLFKVMNQHVSAEVHSAEGRCDCMVETPERVYIFEFKQDRSPKEALQQINDRSYFTPYISSGKQIVKIGANFSSRKRTLEEWVVE